ncbi:MAG: hypothetical protein U0165_17150 [Polyangiaceae bacterium]
MVLNDTISIWDLEQGGRPQRLHRVFFEGVAANQVTARVTDDASIALLHSESAAQLWDLDAMVKCAETNRMGRILASQFIRGTHNLLLETIRARDDVRAFGQVMLHIDASLLDLPPWGHSWWAVGHIRAQATLPNSRRILISGADFGPSVYSTQSGDLVHTFPINPALAQSHPSEPVVNVSGVLTATGSDVCAIIWGTWGNRRNEITLWNAFTGSLIARLPWAYPSLHGRILGSLSHDGSLLGLTGDEGERGDSLRVVRAIETTTGAVLRTWFIGDRINTFAMLPDNQRALTSTEHRISIWHIEQDEPEIDLELTSRVHAWALSGNGLLLAATDDGQLHAYVVEGYRAPIGVDSERSEIWV